MNLPTVIQEDGTSLVLVHFAFIKDGEWRVACTPDRTVLHSTNERTAPWHRTDEPTAVSCPTCKRTEAFKKRYAELQAIRPRERIQNNGIRDITGKVL